MSAIFKEDALAWQQPEITFSIVNLRMKIFAQKHAWDVVWSKEHIQYQYSP